MPQIDKIINHIREYIEDKDVLEIGCGDATFTKLSSNITKTSTALDIESKRVFRNDLGCSFKFIEADAASTGVKDGSFDTVVAANAASHFKDKLEDIIKESMRILKEEGVLILISTWSLDKKAVLDDSIEIARKLNRPFTSYDRPFFVTIIHKV